MVRIAFVSDVHFGPAARHEGKLRKLSQYAAPLLEEFVERMNSVERPDFIVNLGDVVEDETPEVDRKNYATFVDILSRADAEVLHVAGNHELENLSDAQIAELWGTEPPLYYCRELSGLRVVALRTETRRARDIRLPAEQIDWLRETLEQGTLPTIILIHHPLSEMRLEGNRWFEKAPHLARVAERKAVRQVIEESGKVVGVFNGHVHWNHVDVIRGVPYVTVQSMTENIDEDAPGRPSRAFAVVDIDPGGMLVRLEGEHRARYQFGRPAPRKDVATAT